MGVRLQKYLADAGVASRRASEALIRAGHVTINHSPVRELGTKVDPACDHVAVRGRRVQPRRRLYVALHKPTGYICTRHDEANRQTVGELLPREWRDLKPVGRLDRDSEGLLFLSNDGAFCLHLTHPRFGVHKTYQVRAVGRVDGAAVARLKHGVTDHGEILRATAVRVASANASHSTVEIVLNEGRNREVRRMFAVLGFTVERLVRTQIGPIKLGELPAGRWRVLTPPEVEALLRVGPGPAAPTRRTPPRAWRRPKDSLKPGKAHRTRNRELGP